MFLCNYAIFPRDNLSPAVIVWPNSMKGGILFELVVAFLQDEVGIPVQTLFTFNRHAHHTAVKLSILFVTVVWPLRQKENNDKRILTEGDVCSEWSVEGLTGRFYQLRRSFRCTPQGRNTGSWSVCDPSRKCPHFDKDQVYRERLCQQTINE